MGHNALHSVTPHLLRGPVATRLRGKRVFATQTRRTGYRLKAGMTENLCSPLLRFRLLPHRQRPIHDVILEVVNLHIQFVHRPATPGNAGNVHRLRVT